MDYIDNISDFVCEIRVLEKSISCRSLFYADSAYVFRL